MHTLLTSLILLAPLAVAGLLSRVFRRSDPLRTRLVGVRNDLDWCRISHDADAIRTRFEQNPAWPRSGVSDERR